VSGFRLDKYLVTVGRFRRLVAAWNNGAGYLPAAGSGKHAYLNGGQGLGNVGLNAESPYETGWDATDWNSEVSPTNANLACPGPDAWTTTAGAQDDLPMNCVNWYEAYAFCIWDGGFLPTEAEWEYVAAGGSEELEYPWGSAAPGTTNRYAIYGDGNFDCYYPTGTLQSCTSTANIAPVGTASLGVATWGQLDMAGDMFEWNLDWYYAPYADPCTDCSFLTAETERVLRGGGYFTAAVDLLSATRAGGMSPSTPATSVGFRCARAP
jgi:formylglycine-generating enzyme required for sulfatase activity